MLTVTHTLMSGFQIQTAFQTQSHSGRNFSALVGVLEYWLQVLWNGRGN